MLGAFRKKCAAAFSGDAGKVCASKWLIIRRLRKRQTPVPVRLLVLFAYQVRVQRTDFLWNCIFGISVTLRHRVPILIKIWQKWSNHFAQRPAWVYNRSPWFIFVTEADGAAFVIVVRPKKQFLQLTQCVLCVTNFGWSNYRTLRIIDSKRLSTLKRYRLFVSPRTVSRRSTVNLLRRFR